MAKYLFGNYLLDVDERRLLRDNEEIRLRGKLFDTLRVLSRMPASSCAKMRSWILYGRTPSSKTTISTIVFPNCENDSIRRSTLRLCRGTAIDSWQRLPRRRRMPA